MSELLRLLKNARGRDATAILGREPLSYDQLASAAERLSHRLMATGIQPRQLVISALPQGRENIVSILAIRLCGAVVVPVNTLATKDELDHIVSDSGASHMLVPADQGLGGEGVDCGEAFVVRTGAPSVFQPEGEDELVVYTSGSTGRPKGVIIGSDAFAANIAAVSQVLGISEADRTLAATPPQYALALSQVFSHLSKGAGVLPVARGMLDPAAMLEAAAAAGVNALQMNPGMLHVLMQTLGDDFPRLKLRYILLLGQPVSRDFVRLVEQRFPQVAVFNGYGCTENAPRISMGRVSSSSGQTGGVDAGLPVPGTEVSIRDELGAELPAGTRGEICIRGTSLMRGYLNAELTAQQRFINGWFRTRDLGELDLAGRLHVAGRADNVILVGHEKVSPEEIEEHILKVPGVVDVAVSAASDPTYYQVPIAVVVVRSDTVIADIRRTLRTLLSRSRQPVRFHKVESVPRTAYGKVDRSRLKRLVAELEEKHRLAEGLAQRP